VLVTRDNRVKVADFGIARAISQTIPDDDYVVWGTPQYFSPEQAAGEAATPASDVYAIGVILFEMLTGRLPFVADSHTALAVKHMRETPPLITQFNPSVPIQIERVIAKVLSKEPAGRYRTADQFGRILTTYRDSSLEETAGTAGQEIRRPPQAQVIAERKTLYYQPQEKTAPRERTPAWETATVPPPPLHFSNPATEKTDWAAIVLGIITIISLLGLIPLWYSVWTRFAG
jgi:serine/threonine-protein kinase